MMNLIKYEFIKKYSLFTSLLVWGILGNLVCKIIFGYNGSIVYVTAIPWVLFIVYISDLVKSYSSELDNKTGYMLFMTPNSGYAIIFSKLISIFITGAGLVLVYFIISSFNGMMLKVVYEMDFLEVIKLIAIEANYSITFILIVYTSITIRKSILSNSKYRGVLSFIIFLSLSFVIVHFDGLTFFVNNQANIDREISLTLALVFNGIVSVGLAILSGYLLENKINL